MSRHRDPITRYASIGPSNLFCSNIQYERKPRFPSAGYPPDIRYLSFVSSILLYMCILVVGQGGQPQEVHERTPGRPLQDCQTNDRVRGTPKDNQ